MEMQDDKIIKTLPRLTVQPPADGFNKKIPLSQVCSLVGAEKLQYTGKTRVADLYSYFGRIRMEPVRKKPRPISNNLQEQSIIFFSLNIYG